MARGSKGVVVTGRYGLFDIQVMFIRKHTDNNPPLHQRTKGDVQSLGMTRKNLVGWKEVHSLRKESFLQLYLPW